MNTFFCEKCGEMSDFEPHVRQEDDLEIYSLVCPHCGTEYIGSVSDTALRRDVEKYSRMAHVIATMKVTERYIRDAERLHAHNVQRSRSLRQKYMKQH